MKLFSYLGDHQSVTLYGISFPINTPVEVSDEFVIAKLRGNNHFSETFDGVELMPDPAPKRKPGRPRKDA